MDLWMKILMCEAVVLNFAVQGWYFTHMLQLNSSRPERYKKWCHDNESKLVSWPRMLPALCAVTLALSGLDEWISIAVCGVIVLITALVNWPKKAKKPLVVTARVKRLFITEALLCAVLLCLCG